MPKYFIIFKLPSLAITLSAVIFFLDLINSKNIFLYDLLYAIFFNISKTANSIFLEKTNIYFFISKIQ